MTALVLLRSESLARETSETRRHWSLIEGAVKLHFFPGDPGAFDDDVTMSFEAHSVAEIGESSLSGVLVMELAKAWRLAYEIRYWALGALRQLGRQKVCKLRRVVRETSVRHSSRAVSDLRHSGRERQEPRGNAHEDFVDGVKRTRSLVEVGKVVTLIQDFDVVSESSS